MYSEPDVSSPVSQQQEPDQRLLDTSFPNAQQFFANAIPIDDLIADEVKHLRERIGRYLNDLNHWSDRGLAVEFEYYGHLIPRAEINKIISELTDVKCGFDAFESRQDRFVLVVEFTPPNYRNS